MAAGGGLIYAFFAPAFNVATNDNFGLLADGVPPLSIYATDFYFSIGFTAVSVVRHWPMHLSPGSDLSISVSLRLTFRPQHVTCLDQFMPTHDSADSRAEGHFGVFDSTF